MFGFGCVVGVLLDGVGVGVIGVVFSMLEMGCVFVFG